jgi:hypothetical protein
MGKSGVSRRQLQLHAGRHAPGILENDITRIHLALRFRGITVFDMCQMLHLTRKPAALTLGYAELVRRCSSCHERLGRDD